MLSKDLEQAETIDIDTDDCVDHLMSMAAKDIVALGLPAAITVDGSVITRSTHEAIKARGKSGLPLIA